MWYTRKSFGMKWKHLPQDREDGPKIAVNASRVTKLGLQPRLKAAPNIKEVRAALREEEEEDNEVEVVEE